MLLVLFLVMLLLLLLLQPQFGKTLLSREGSTQGSHESVIVRKLLVNSFVSQLTIANELVLRHRRCISGRVDVLTEPLH